jgi:hypothetical protein
MCLCKRLVHLSVATRIAWRHRIADAVGIAMIALALLACDSKPPEIYEIPDGYRGWVEIRAKRLDCGPLPRSGDAVVFSIPASGVLCTSSPILSGLGREDFYYVGNGRRIRLQGSAVDPNRMIWGVNGYGNEGGTHDRLRFFVGTKSEYEVAQAHE